MNKELKEAVEKLKGIISSMSIVTGEQLEALEFILTFIEEILKEECKHVKEDSIAADCILCRLVVAEKGLDKQRELRLKAKKFIEGLPSEEELKILLFDKFGFSQVDGKCKNWRALRLIECAKTINKRIMEGR